MSYFVWVYKKVCVNGFVIGTSLKHRAADGRSGGAGRRQLRVQGLGVLGGSSGPHMGVLLETVPFKEG